MNKLLFHNFTTFKYNNSTISCPCGVVSIVMMSCTLCKVDWIEANFSRSLSRSRQMRIFQHSQSPRSVHGSCAADKLGRKDGMVEFPEISRYPNSLCCQLLTVVQFSLPWHCLSLQLKSPSATASTRPNAYFQDPQVNHQSPQSPSEKNP